MWKLKGKLVGSLLIGFMMVVIGCSSNTPENKNTPGATSSPNENQPDKQTAQPTTEGPKDFGAIKVIIGQGYSKNTDNDLVIDYIKEKSGVKLEPLWTDGSVDKFALMIASGEEVDAQTRPLNMYYSDLASGSLMPLSKLIDEYGPNLKKRINPELWSWVTDEKGEIHGIPVESFPMPHTVQIRKDWLKEQNLAVPTTIEEFESVMLKFKEAYKTSPLLVKGLTTHERFDWSLAGAFLPEGYSWWKNEEGKYLPPEMHPEYKTMLATLNSWFKKGIIHPENFIGNYFQVHPQLIDANKIGANMGWYSGAFRAEPFSEKYPDAEFATIQPLKGKFDHGYMQVASPSNVVSISVNSKNAIGVIKFLDWLCEDLENMIVSRFGIPGVHWDYVDKEKGITKALPDAGTKFVGGTFEMLDVYNYLERQDTAEAPYLQWYYNIMDDIAANKINPRYISNELKARVADGTLKSADVMNDVNSAADEARIAIITGAKPVSYWDEFLETWKKIGMNKVIEEKGALIAERLK
ncbi:extracellular solute-binding protein [Paenibacillus eucommiae]|uniref:Aldouronate transport system substrate-binding protein n=1 Tax=Paenibacillus eucommiae TaxID=1355755 RepID=A0ABS4IRC1_9BACL|nr:extracellular solute-binding protein [Paenibacillus eucommiae]MBP1990114.1 putative aldouronate transport system substrate-binding protein [Paenibacillus eucommiae]